MYKSADFLSFQFLRSTIQQMNTVLAAIFQHCCYGSANLQFICEYTVAQLHLVPIVIKVIQEDPL